VPRCRIATGAEAYPGVPVVAGGVEASLRRLAHYDYWSDTVRRSILLDCKADLVAYGMGEQLLIVEIAKRFAAGLTVRQMRDLRRCLSHGSQRDARRTGKTPTRGHQRHRTLAQL
jgi:radical SAM superfamily enzyme YgiQ (UPF0313 family)